MADISAKLDRLIETHSVLGEKIDSLEERIKELLRDIDKIEDRVNTLEKNDLIIFEQVGRLNDGANKQRESEAKLKGMFFERILWLITTILVAYITKFF